MNKLAIKFIEIVPLNTNLESKEANCFNFLKFSSRNQHNRPFCAIFLRISID